MESYPLRRALGAPAGRSALLEQRAAARSASLRETDCEPKFLTLDS